MAEVMVPRDLLQVSDCIGEAVLSAIGQVLKSK
jgi:hypothetical protein